MKKFSFKKKFRLLSSQQYKNVFKHSYIVKFKEIFIFSRKNNVKYSRLGISIAKKNIKKANKRNYFKRVIREFFRINKENFCKMDFVVNIKRQDIKSHKFFLKRLSFLWYKNFFKPK
ncbi:ribonuclease P protein component [Buchnera aphidicola]|uniref:ribonuclease P protein component n=1 Tax=Buchnera aphidicola TaxID=9 RepID=UPI0020925740|nr:ribonuclease P protein component [Buchnera aphidicola]USS94148.1 ribonuclease P protein component [Buchnera aphidicola (Sipha maydis)]